MRFERCTLHRYVVGWKEDDWGKFKVFIERDEIETAHLSSHGGLARRNCVINPRGGTLQLWPDGRLFHVEESSTVQPCDQEALEKAAENGVFLVD